MEVWRLSLWENGALVKRKDGVDMLVGSGRVCGAFETPRWRCPVGNRIEAPDVQERGPSRPSTALGTTHCVLGEFHFSSYPAAKPWSHGVEQCGCGGLDWIWGFGTLWSSVCNHK